jgi:hypothetical protein
VDNSLAASGWDLAPPTAAETSMLAQCVRFQLIEWGWAPGCGGELPLNEWNLDYLMPKRFWGEGYIDYSGLIPGWTAPRPDRPVLIDLLNELEKAGTLVALERPGVVYIGMLPGEAED